MDTSVARFCFLLAIISVFQPALQKSVETERGEAISLAQTRRGREDNKPSDQETLNKGGAIQRTPSPCPNGLSFCESTDDYPKDFINEMLKKQPKIILDLLKTEGFQPALQKSVETERGEAISLAQTRRSREAANDAIHFPADTKPSDQETLNRGGGAVQNITPSPCPNGLSFCESTDDYPKDFIKEMLKKQPKLLLHQLYSEDDSDDVFNKFDADDPIETPLCVSVKRIVYPTKAQSNEGLFFVVNDDDYRQGVKVESCMSDGGQCQIPGSLSIGYTSRCVQRHIVRTLVVLNKNSSDVEGFVTKPFEFPSCCSCVVSMTINRFGNSLVGSGSSVNSTTTVKTPFKPKNTKS